MVPSVDSPDPQVFVLFGARGDLSRRKLLPGLFHLIGAGLMPDDYRLIGTGRHALDTDFAEEAADAVERADGTRPSGEQWDTFAQRMSFVASSAEDGTDLAAAVADAQQALGERARVLLYMAVPPSAMRPMVGMLGQTGLASKRARVVLEKPFGSDLHTAKQLNATLHEHFAEDQIFRIDHFLGKEPVQDILALRFANGLFEPIWNRRHVAAVQIDIPEELGLEGRGSFYDETGAFRDMVVTHLAQILGFIAMDSPDSLQAGSLRDAKAALFDDLCPFDPKDAVYGQFDGYREEAGVGTDSQTETFAALRVHIDNDRWRGVPYLLRTGKALAATRRTVSIALHEPERELFTLAPNGTGSRPNELVFELTDDPQIAIDVRVKDPGPTLTITEAPLTLDVERAVHERGLEAYERLLHDVMLGDHLLFTRADEVERLWACAEPLLQGPPAPVTYEKGTWGPQAADALAPPPGWRLPER